MNATLFLDAALDALLDSLRMLPFLFVAFLILEALEHYSSNRLPLLRRHCHSRNLDCCILIHFG